MKPKATIGRRKGQTLVMALIILGVLMVLGIVFVALVGRNIRSASASQKRSLAYDLAESGVRYVHSQMLNSLQGADWRPTPTPLPIAITDPDYEFIRPPNPADPLDHGGPDKQGPYTRLIFDRGRALVRARFAPSDPSIFAVNPVGNLIQPGLARNYTVIEAVGKSGNYLLNDPTSTGILNGTTRENVESKRVIAFVSCGLIEQARFITNKFRVSSPAELGCPTELGVTYDDSGLGAQTVSVPVVFGNFGTIANPTTYPTPSAGTTPGVPYGGGVYVNADLLLHGNVVTYVNQMLGDSVLVAGSVRGADDAASLTLNVATANGAAWQFASASVSNNTSPSLNSGNNNFSTIGGVFKDAFPNGDSQGFPRSIMRKDPPSTLWTDPETGVNRYVQMSQFSGRVYNFGNAGRFGHGRNVYVNNAADIQVPIDEQGREDVGSAESLTYDWLNPNNGQAASGWKGAFYVPRGAYLRLLDDGFIIVRDSKAPNNQRTWREPDGSIGKRAGAQMNSGNPADQLDSQFIRYKLVYDPATRTTYIFNSLSALPSGVVIDVNAVNSGNISNYRDAGYPFDGVLYFAGNVRVRGQIPTDMQMTVVSNATIYIEGSITKGIVNNGTRSNMAIGRRIDTPSKSMLALLAKDFITLNTTQFFGTVPNQQLDEVKDNPGPVEWNPLRVATGGSIGFITEFLLDPNTPPGNGGNPNNPSTWSPYVTQYTPAGSINGFETTSLLLAHATDDGAAPVTFISMDVNNQVPPNSNQWPYLFELSANNAASPFFPLGYTPPGYSIQDHATLYGLGGQVWQRYGKLESAAFPLVTSDFTFTPLNMMVNGSNTSPSGLYHLLMENNNDFTLGLRDTVGAMPTNDYILGRAAIVPHDIRIDATCFAEEGSFFVIPGPWFNPEPNDRRDSYMSLGATQAERDMNRQEKFGSSPATPFYGEPLDVKIQIVGSVTENMPPPISQQAEWLRKWGWIPRYHGATGELIPAQHTSGYDVTPGGANKMYVPNITITYDPALATDRNQGFVGAAGPAVDLNTMIRYQGVDLDNDGNPDVYYALPPIPRLPVSPTLAYFGEVNP